MRQPIKGFLAAAAVGAFLMAARPSSAQDARWGGSSNWRGSGEQRFHRDFHDRGFRDRDRRFHDRDGRFWHGRGFVAPYYYDDYAYAVPYGYYDGYAAPVYPYYRPRVIVRLPFPRFHLPFPRFHHRFGW